MPEQPSPQVKRMRLRYAGVCRACSAPLAAGAEAGYFRAEREVACLGCIDTPPTREASLPVVDEPDRVSDAVDEGTAGASARREHERRSAKREQRIREAHPRLGGLMLALTDDPQSTQSWARGAVGEERVGAALAKLSGVRVLHDRRIPRTRANIDHIVIAPAGVFVIDAKRYKGRPTLRVTGGILRPRTETLLVGGRDCTKLVAGVLHQVDLVRSALSTDARDPLPVTAMLCFVDADWPLIGGSFTTQGVHILWPRKIADFLYEPAVLDAAEIVSLHATLARAFPRA